MEESKNYIILKNSLIAKKELFINILNNSYDTN